MEEIKKRAPQGVAHWEFAGEDIGVEPIGVVIELEHQNEHGHTSHASISTKTSTDTHETAKNRVTFRRMLWVIPGAIRDLGITDHGNLIE